MSDITKEEGDKGVVESAKTVLFVDAYNAFIRSYAAYPSMTANGEQCGGIVGVMKTIIKLIETVMPHKIVFVWESGGSARRRSIFLDYKKDRRPEKLNRYYEDDIPDTLTNQQWQLGTTIKMLQLLPVCQVYVQDCEADDVITYLSKVVYNGWNQFIVSNDRDYYQLLTEDNIGVYNLHKKKIVKSKEAQDEFGVPVHNFALAKALCGDDSDNVPGVPGAGFKSLVKAVPIFLSKDEIRIDQVLSYCHAQPKKSKLQKLITESEAVIRRNWKLVQLSSTFLSATQIEQVEYSITNWSPQLDHVKVIKLITQTKIRDLDPMALISAVSYLTKQK
jgi:DNA polymerase-1